MDAKKSNTSFIILNVSKKSYSSSIPTAVKKKQQQQQHVTSRLVLRNEKAHI